MTGIQGPENISTKQRRIAELAKKAPEMAFTGLSQHIDVEWLREAYRRTRKSGAVGVDGQTAQDYAENLEENLRSLLDRAKSGMYQAPPVRRVHIPKAGSATETRPIGIPTFEDKVLQRAVVMVLESVYEQDFYEFSYGFRPGRNAHQALSSVREQLMRMGGGWVLEVDIRKFFDTLDKGHLQKILSQRVRDGVIVRLLGKWLNAGVMEEGAISHPESGSPQGGVVSPVLANVYLHEVLDKWFVEQVKPRLKGATFVVRYADDVVMGFAREEDARRVMEVLPKRFEKYGLKLHPEKTRMLPFQSPGRSPSQDEDDRKGPGTFDMLGFTHYWARSRQGRWVIKQKTAKGRFARAVERISEWCQRNRHRRLAEQRETLNRKLMGHYNYYGITGNSDALSRFRYQVNLLWHKWLNRRSQRKSGDWKWFNRILERFPLAKPVAVHSLYRRVAKP